MKIRAFAVVACAVLVTATLRAAVIYSSFGAGNTYNPGGGWLIGHPEFHADTGFGFIAGDTFRLDQVSAAIAVQSGTNQIELWLMSDAGFQPGSVIESFKFIGGMGPDGTMNPPLTAMSVLQPELQSGAMYWLIASAPIADTFAVWNMNNQGASGPRAYREFGGSWATNISVDLGAFEIQGTAIPEPGSLLLLVAGLALLVAKTMTVVSHNYSPL